MSDDSIILTLLVSVDAEKPREYLDWHATAINRWNGGAEGVQVLFIDQSARGPHTRAGYPIWDVLADTREAWPQIVGEYVSWQHIEFLWCPGRLRSTVEYLRETRPVLALGNLRRTGTSDDNSERESQRITDHLRRGDFAAAAQQAEQITTTPWLGWPHEPERHHAQVWWEDVFFVRRDWLETTRFCEWGGPQHLQDVYDLMGASLAKLAYFETVPSMPRMPQEIHRQIHLWHPRTMRCYAPDVRDLFLSDPKRWAGTLYASKPHWKQLVKCWRDGTRDPATTHSFRGDPGGSVYRHAMAFEEWLVDDDGGTVHRYLQRHRQMQEVG